jgi:hypothetical protein
MDGEVVRWVVSNNVPPTDILLEMVGLNLITKVQYAESFIQKEKDQTEAIARYREARKNYVHSDEELYEMRSAFGEGTKVIDVISGVVTVV